MVPPCAATPSPSKGTLVFVLIALMIIVSVASIVGLISEVRHDGYRRAPQRNLVRAF